MADKFRISGDELGKALGNVLAAYNRRTTDRINIASEETAKELVRVTKRRAPRRTNKYQKAISYQLKEKRITGNVFVWCPNAPHYRRTHLLVHGHRTHTGKRTQANDFLEKSIEEVQPNHDARLEAAITGDQI